MQVLSIVLLSTFTLYSKLSGFWLMFVINCASLVKYSLSVSLFLFKFHFFKLLHFHLTYYIMTSPDGYSHWNVHFTKQRCGMFIPFLQTPFIHGVFYSNFQSLM